MIAPELTRADERAYLKALRHDPCAYCGCSTCDGPMVLDHIVPRIEGGEDGWNNRTAACDYCNGAKSARSLLGHLGAARLRDQHRALLDRIVAQRSRWRLLGRSL